MRVARLRRRVDPRTFAGWVSTLPGLGLPAEFRQLPTDLPSLTDPEVASVPEIRSGTRDRLEVSGDSMAQAPSPALAISLAVHGASGATARVRLHEPGRELVAVVSVLAGMAAGLALCRRQRTTWVEVSLLPVREAVTEVLRWVPEPVQPGRARGRAGRSLEIAVVAMDDVVWRWLDTWQDRGAGWERVRPGPGSILDQPANAAGAEGARLPGLAGHRRELGLRAELAGELAEVLSGWTDDDDG